MMASVSQAQVKEGFLGIIWSWIARQRHCREI